MTGQIVLADPDVVVADDVLDAPTFSNLAGSVEHGQFRSVHHEHWDPSWPPSDGSPLRGRSIVYDPQDRHDGPSVRYPTSSPVDALIEAILRLVGTHPATVGGEDRDWSVMYLSPWLYPAGSALSPHHDAGPYTGAFTFFVHRDWSTGWGGELVIERGSGGSPARSPHATWLSGAARDLSAAGSGVGLSIAPRPNRLVLVGADRRHRIARVDSTASGHVRASIAGFFIR